MLPSCNRDLAFGSVVVVVVDVDLVDVDVDVVDVGVDVDVDVDVVDVDVAGLVVGVVPVVEEPPVEDVAPCGAEPVGEGPELSPVVHPASTIASTENAPARRP